MATKTAKAVRKRRPVQGGRRAERVFGHGGLRPGAGRGTMFPGKYDPGGVPRAKLGLTVTSLGRELLEEVRDDLYNLPPEGHKTLSDAVEYCARMVKKVSLDAS